MEAAIFCPWFGAFPRWWSEFEDRAQQVRGMRLFVPTDQVGQRFRQRRVDYVPFSEPQIRERMSWAGADWRLGTLGRAGELKVRDLRPLFGVLFGELLGDAEWWGWCDAEIVFGRIDGLLAGGAEYDVVAAKAGSELRGSLALLKNTRQCNELYRDVEGWRQLVCNPVLVNFSRRVLQVRPEECPRLRIEEFACGSSAYYPPWHGTPNRTPGNPQLIEKPNGRLFDTLLQVEIVFFEFSPWDAWPRIAKAKQAAGEQSAGETGAV